MRARSSEQIQQFTQLITQNDGEGLIARGPLSLYTPSRSDHFVKFKVLPPPFLLLPPPSFSPFFNDLCIDAQRHGWHYYKNRPQLSHTETPNVCNPSPPLLPSSPPLLLSFHSSSFFLFSLICNLDRTETLSKSMLRSLAMPIYKREKSSRLRMTRFPN